MTTHIQVDQFEITESILLISLSLKLGLVMCDRPMSVHASIETIDRLSKLMIGWVLEYDVSPTVYFLIEIKKR
jgi:hypothetical protein